MARKSFSQLTDAGKRARIAADVIAQLDAKKISARTGTYLELTLDEEYLKELVKELSIEDILSGAADSIQDLINDMSIAEAAKKSSTCEACAMGALFTCAVQMKNGLSVTDASGEVDVDSWSAEAGITVERGAMDDRLLDYFSKDQLRLIETAFECSDFTDDVDDDDDDDDYGSARTEFDYTYSRHLPVDPKKRAAAIKRIEDRRTERTTAGSAAIKFGSKHQNVEKRMRAIMQNIVDNRGTFIP